MTAVAGAADAARNAGYAVHVIDAAIVGEAREAAPDLREQVQDVLARVQPPLCVIGSGETTVHVTGDGLGGRNQEFALAMLPWISELAAEDGEDAFGDEREPREARAAPSRHRVRQHRYRWH